MARSRMVSFSAISLLTVNTASESPYFANAQAFQDDRRTPVRNLNESVWQSLDESAIIPSQGAATVGYQPPRLCACVADV